VAELEARGHAATAARGANDQFDVRRDGELLFSKEEVGRFPQLDEILGKLG
jgi:hypothetical protein